MGGFSKVGGGSGGFCRPPPPGYLHASTEEIFAFLLRPLLYENFVIIFKDDVGGFFESEPLVFCELKRAQVLNVCFFLICKRFILQ